MRIWGSFAIAVTLLLAGCGEPDYREIYSKADFSGCGRRQACRERTDKKEMSGPLPTRRLLRF